MKSTNSIGRYLEENISVRKAKPEDARDYASLETAISPLLFGLLFGEKAKKILSRMYRVKGNLFSFEHSFIIEINGVVAGMALGFDWKVKRRQFRSTLLLLILLLRFQLLERLPFWIREWRTLNVSEEEFYLNSLSVFPEFRGRGLGTELLKQVESEALQLGCKKIKLDVYTGNERAKRLYERFGFRPERHLVLYKISGEQFESLTMWKTLGEGEHKPVIEGWSGAREMKRAS